MQKIEVGQLDIHWNTSGNISDVARTALRHDGSPLKVQA